MAGKSRGQNRSISCKNFQALDRAFQGGSACPFSLTGFLISAIFYSNSLMLHIIFARVANGSCDVAFRVKTIR